MALLSPGVEVTVIDESQYIPAATNSVPYVLLATAQNKVSGAGAGIAAGTLKVNANKVYLITSQRDLAATYGVPFFYKTTTGTPINGYELNEYGLLAAYSALGVSNRCYVQRVDIDLAELTASLTRPTGAPENGTYWFDVANTLFGAFEWNQTTGAFSNKVPSVILDSANVDSGTLVPLESFGNIGDYALVGSTINIHNPLYYKCGAVNSSQTTATDLSDYYNQWVLVGSDEWKTAWATIQGTAAPTFVTQGLSFAINDEIITVRTAPDNTVTRIMEDINAADIPGVYAAVIGGKLNLYANSLATNDGSTEGVGVIAINNVIGTPLTTLGITAGQYRAPAFDHGFSYQQPRWNTSGPTPEPTGSIWIKMNSVNLGARWSVKKYDSALGAFVQQACPMYNGDASANAALDPSGGGQNIPAGSTYVTVDQFNDNQANFEIYERLVTGPTIVTSSLTTYSFTPNTYCIMRVSQPGTNELLSTTVGIDPNLTDFGASAFQAGVSVASAALGGYVTCTINSAGALVLEHTAGGEITMEAEPGGGNIIAATGFNTTCVGVRAYYEGAVQAGFILSNWVTTPTFTYTSSTTAPNEDPATGRLWYYSATDQVDIMIQNNGSWFGYQMVNNDVRGYNLTQTSPNGPIIGATPPAADNGQSDGTPLVYGDLWISTANLELYPQIYRWENIDGQDQWILIDNADQTTDNGVLFADARWAPNGTTNPITAPLPTITSLLDSDYVDLDAPEPTLYPQGMLLFNTRRSGFNVKSFQANYFNATAFPDSSLPTEKNAWVTASGNRADGSPYMGRQAQRALIVAALKAGIDTNTQAREEQRVFNLIGCPQYPELAPNMVALNNERQNTAFVVVDTPLRLTPEEVVDWATNNNGEGNLLADGLVVGDAYSGAFYPSCTTTDLSGSVVVQPPSHMMLRTIIRSDEVAYPWLAPAGTRRGVIDNATQIGYIDAVSGEFQSIGVRQGLRDVLYENRINPITFVPGVGITNFGNKTLTSNTTALDRINVARLVSFIRARLESIAKQYLFEPNDTITRNQITNVITSLMIDLVAKRGIYDYLVVCDTSNNTPARIDRNELYVDIAIEPVKAVEFIYIPVRIKNTGAIAAQSTI